MADLDELQRMLRGLDGRGYKAYKSIRGRYAAPGFTLHVDHVQGDPFAEPSRFRAVVGPEEAGLPEWTRNTPPRRRAAADFVNRRLHDALASQSRRSGSGKSGELRALRPGQAVLDRSALELSAEGRVEARFRVGLPAKGRRIKGAAAAELVCGAVVEALKDALFFQSLDADPLRLHVETVEDAGALRSQLADHGLVAFVAAGAALPRRSGIDDRPLDEAAVTPFEVPETLAVTLDTPNAGPLRGMGVPEGVTLIVGGGYHGKSTVLRAIERGIYDHVPGDGRERVVTIDTAVKIRAEDGRRVEGTDISNFISGLPGGADTRSFRTENASGSTSQAAAIAEAVELGATALLLDEDTSATNFMIRDARMQRLIASRDEPITPFIDRARQLYEDEGISTVVVVGGSGDYFDVADTVVAMRSYRPAEVTREAREVADTLPTHREGEGGEWAPLRRRIPLPASIDPRRGKRPVSIRVRARDRVDFGTHTVDLAAVEQLVEEAQTRAIANAVVWAKEADDAAIDGSTSLGEAVEAVVRRLRTGRLVDLHPHRIGELAEFRTFELAAFLNRLRTLETVDGEGA